MVLYDWQRGKIPYFSLPPDYKPEEELRVVAAAEAAVDAETRAELPVPAGGVTEEDAQGEAGAEAGAAAAGARWGCGGGGRLRACVCVCGCNEHACECVCGCLSMCV